MKTYISMDTRAKNKRTLAKGNEKGSVEGGSFNKAEHQGEKSAKIRDKGSEGK